MTITDPMLAMVDDVQAQLEALKPRLRRLQETDVLPEHRMLLLAGHLIALLQDLETAIHEFGRWLPPDPAGGSKA